MIIIQNSKTEQKQYKADAQHTIRRIFHPALRPLSVLLFFPSFLSSHAAFLPLKPEIQEWIVSVVDQICRAQEKQAQVQKEQHRLHPPFLPLPAADT